MTLGDRVQQLLSESTLSQADLARQLHISASALSSYIHNRREPDFHTLSSLADFFHVSIDYLLCRTDIRHHSPEDLSPQESLLLDTYRNLNQDRKSLLVEQARLYERFDSGLTSSTRQKK